jgi:hypothetical protein
MPSEFEKSRKQKRNYKELKTDIINYATGFVIGAGGTGILMLIAGYIIYNYL